MNGKKALFTLMALLLLALPAGAEEFEGRVVGVSHTGDRLVVRTVSENELRAFEVPDLLAPLVKDRSKGDIVLLSTDGEGGLRDLELKVVPVSRTHRLLGLLCGVVVFFGLVALLSRSFAPWGFMLGKDGRYSASKSQAFLWFFLLVVSYVAAVVVRLTASGFERVLDVVPPENLVLLAGFSLLTMGAAKGITQFRVEAGGTAVKTTGQPKFPEDLVSTDEGKPDFGSLQMVVIVLLSAAGYLLLLWKDLGHVPLTSPVALPDPDQTLLGLFAISQGGYLTKKYLGDNRKPPTNKNP